MIKFILFKYRTTPLTESRESKLSTNYSGINCIPKVITNCTPRFICTYFYPTSICRGTTYQSNTAMATNNCKAEKVSIKKYKTWQINSYDLCGKQLQHLQHVCSCEHQYHCLDSQRVWPHFQCRLNCQEGWDLCPARMQQNYGLEHLCN